MKEDGVSPRHPVDVTIEDILDSLFEVGGAAHCELVLRILAERFGHGQLSEAARRQAIRLVDEHCLSHWLEPQGGLIYKPFGEPSMRWSLTDRARRSIRRPSPISAWAPSPQR